MTAPIQIHEYLAELRRQVCEHCIVRRSGTPPCDAKGIGCGIERHLEKLVEICRSVESSQIDPYVQRLHDDICADCEFRETAVCPCPLDYLLPLAVRAVETVEFRRREIKAAANT
jgi:hypothetical protein